MSTADTGITIHLGPATCERIAAATSRVTRTQEALAAAVARTRETEGVDHDHAAMLQREALGAFRDAQAEASTVLAEVARAMGGE